MPRVKAAFGLNVSDLRLKVKTFDNYSRFADFILSTHGTDKNGSYLIPCLPVKNGTRNNDDMDVIAHHCFDFDNEDAVHRFQTILRIGALQKYNYIWYTTFSHTRTSPRIRLLLQSKGNIPASGYESVQRQIAADFGLLLNRESRVASQPMFLPRYGFRGDFHEGGELLSYDADLLQAFGDSPENETDESARVFKNAPSGVITVDEAIGMLTVIPPEDPRVPNFDEDGERGKRGAWIQVGTALKAGLGEKGLPLFLAWSSGEYTKDGSVPINWAGDADVETQWRAFKVGKGITVASLVWRAEQFGYEAPSNDAPDELQDWIWVSCENKYYRPETEPMGVVPSAWRLLVMPYLKKWNCKAKIRFEKEKQKVEKRGGYIQPLPIHELMVEENVLTCVHNRVYMPGAPVVWKNQYNTYVDTGIKTRADSPELRALREKIIKMYSVAFPDWRWRLMLDFAAFTYQHPDKLIKWMLIAYSRAQGVGKSFLTVMLRLAMGDSNVSSPSSDVIIDRTSTEWSNVKFIELEELTPPSRHDEMMFREKLKRYVSNETMNGRRSGGFFYSQPKVTNFYATMNEIGAFRTKSEDRRWAVVASPFLHQRYAEAYGLTPDLLREIYNGTKKHPEIGDYILGRWDISPDFDPLQAPEGDTKVYQCQSSTPEEEWISAVLDQSKLKDSTDIFKLAVNEFFATPSLLVHLSEIAIGDRTEFSVSLSRPFTEQTVRRALEWLGYTPWVNEKGQKGQIQIYGVLGKSRICLRPMVSARGSEMLRTWPKITGESFKILAGIV